MINNNNKCFYNNNFDEYTFKKETLDNYKKHLHTNKTIYFIINKSFSRNIKKSNKYNNSKINSNSVFYDNKNTYTNNINNEDINITTKKEYNLINKKVQDIDNIVSQENLQKKYDIMIYNEITADKPKRKKTLTFEDKLKQLETDYKAISKPSKIMGLNNDEYSYTNDDTNSYSDEINQYKYIINKLDEVKKSKSPLPYMLSKVKEIHDKVEQEQSYDPDITIKYNKFTKEPSDKMNKKANKNNNEYIDVDTETDLKAKSVILDKSKLYLEQDFENEEINKTIKDDDTKIKKYYKELSLMQNKHDNSIKKLQKSLDNTDNSLINLNDYKKIREIKQQIDLEVVEKEREMKSFKALVERDIRKGVKQLKDKVDLQLNVDRIRDLKGLPKTKESILLRSKIEKLEDSKQSYK